MNMIFIACLFLVIPIAVILLCQKFPFLDKVGAVVIAFLLGILFANTIDMNAFMTQEEYKSLQDNVINISIALTLPLLMFSIHIKKTIKLAKPALISMLFAVFSVVLMSVLCAFLFADQIDKVWDVAGMAVGAYTGSSPNMAAIKAATNADENVFITMVSYDILMSGVYIVFILTIGKSIFRPFLKPYEHKVDADSVDSQVADDVRDSLSNLSDESAVSYASILKKGNRKGSFLALLLAVVVVGLSVTLGGLFPEGAESTMVIILLTTLGLLASLIPFVRNIPTSFNIGMFLIMIFCFAIGTQTDIGILTNLNVPLVSYIALLLTGSMVIQAIFCKIFKIDHDTFLMTSAASVLSVPFIPVVANALKNKQILLPGMAAAILGYALGNYAGIAVVQVLSTILA